MQKQFVLYLVGFLLLGLHACTKPVNAKFFKKQANRFEHIADLLRRDNVNVIRVGDSIKIIMFTDNFFRSNSNHFRMEKQSTIAHIVALMKQVNTISVQVAGYNTQAATAEENIALSIAQAEIIANYLWQGGIEARLLYATGYGAQNLISKHSQKTNNRIEISLKHTSITS